MRLERILNIMFINAVHNIIMVICIMKIYHPYRFLLFYITVFPANYLYAIMLHYELLLITEMRINSDI